MTAIAVVATTLTLTVVASSSDKTDNSKACADATVILDQTIVQPGAEIMATSTVNNCSKRRSTVSIEQVLTDPCGEEVSMSVTTFTLRKGEARQAMVSFLAPGTSSCPGQFMVTARVTANGEMLANPSTFFTVNDPELNQ